MTTSPSVAQTVHSSLSEQDLSLLQGVNILLEGPAGSGKTWCLGTLVDAFPQLEVFYIALESGMESLFAYWQDRGKEIPPNLHWHQLQLATPGGFGQLEKTANLIAQGTQSSLTKIVDFDRHKNNPYARFLSVMNNFDDQRTGEKFGAVDTWGPNRCIIWDALTGLGNFVMAMQVGLKPVRDKPDYGVVQDQLERVIRYTCDGCKCHFIMLAHIERETDEVLGGSKIMTSAPGQKLSPKLPSMFSDTILTERRGTEWTWSTANPSADLKTRNLPVAEKINPDLAQIFRKWHSRGGRFSATVKT